MLMPLPERVKLESYVPVPNALWDTWLPQVGPSAGVVMFFLARKTYGWRREEDAVSLSQISKGTGLAVSTVMSAIARLEAFGVVSRERQRDARRGDTATVYRLIVEAKVSCATPHPPSSKSDDPPHRDPMTPVRNFDEARHRNPMTPVIENPGHNKQPDNIHLNNNMTGALQAMVEAGVARNVGGRLVRELGDTLCLKVVAWAMAAPAGALKNRPAWIVGMLKNPETLVEPGWVTEQRKRVEAQQQQQQRSIDRAREVAEQEFRRARGRELYECLGVAERGALEVMVTEELAGQWGRRKVPAAAVRAAVEARLLDND